MSRTVLHRSAIERLRAEPYDPHWSRQAAYSIQADLETLQDVQGFNVVEVDCRTAGCTAELEWVSRRAAVESLAALLHHRYEQRCGRRILFEEDEGARSSYRATLIFECER